MAKSGLQFYIKGFTGAASITDGSDTVTKTPTFTSSPLEILESLATLAAAEFGGAWQLSVTTAGRLILNSTGAGSWTLNFTGTTGALCGFTSASYSSVSSVISDTTPSGSFFPYSDQIGIVYALDVRSPMGAGKKTSAAGFWLNTPGTNQKRPLLKFSVLRPEALEFLDAVQDLGNPAKVDVWDGTTRLPLFVGSIRTTEQNAIDGWTEFELEVVR